MTAPTPDDDPTLVELFHQLAEVVDHLEQNIDDLTHRIHTLEQQEHHPWPTANEGLRHWVNTFLIPTFHMESLLKDWETNNAVMSELLALHAAYREMEDPKATGWDKVSWHRNRAETEERIRIHIKRASGPAAGWDTH